jgi:mRNA degradation ribonuclease J1/J2
MLSLTRPISIVPIGAGFRQMKQYSNMAQQMGYSEDKILLPSGSKVVEVEKGGRVYLENGNVIPRVQYAKSLSSGRGNKKFKKKFYGKKEN